jgi:hypothetical protein
VEVVGWTVHMNDIVVGKPERNIPRRRWADNIKINLIKLGKQL